MTKTKWYILGGISLGLAIVSLTTFLIKPAKAETTSTTFPVDEAGIAAYVKLDSVDITDLTEALNFYVRGKDMRQGETYTIGVVEVPNIGGYNGSNYPHLYIGLDGWMVAYYLKEEEVSRIMQWRNYEKGIISTTTLQDAIDIMANNIGVTYSTPIKYYNFEFPEANKLTLIAETSPSSAQSGGSNSFSVTIPGILYEASYSLYWSFGGYDRWIKLNVDENEVVLYNGGHGSPGILYGYYDPVSHLKPNVPHLVTLSWYFIGSDKIGAATVLIYKSP